MEAVKPWAVVFEIATQLGVGDKAMKKWRARKRVPAKWARTVEKEAERRGVVGSIEHLLADPRVTQKAA
jgi:2-hydroxychromene-2-carboxylate isomerase